MNIDVDALMRPARDALHGIPEIKWFLQDYEDVILDPANNANHQQLLDTVFDGKGGLINIGGDLYVIYIPRGSNYRFHVAECATIKSMRAKNRFERYILTRNTSGIFKIYPDNAPEYEHDLDVCQNCLHSLSNISPKKYREMQSVFIRDHEGRFDIATFFEIYGGKINFAAAPAKTDSSTMLQGGYPREWTKISQQIRASAQWRCQKCGVDLSDRPRLLHVHHKNSDKQDISTSNLIALCALCHRELPGHSFVNISNSDRIYIMSKRLQRS